MITKTEHNNTKINQVAVLGSGVMGSQIAALFANANISTLLFSHKSTLADDWDKITRLKPAAFTADEQQNWIKLCCYEEDLPQLANCDLVIEAIIEDLAAKQTLFADITPHLSAQVILASNTSSLSINQIASHLGQHSSRFCGIHFFNPPRYMPLVELIANTQTTPDILITLETFLTNEMGKNVLHSQDKAGFIANRIGVFQMAACVFHSERLQLGFDTVDALTGQLLQRPKSATFRTADLVGLDILHSVLQQFHQQHSTDPWHSYFRSPNWLIELIAQKRLGNKTNIGIYQKQDDIIKVYQPQSKTYAAINTDIEPAVKQILQQPIDRQIACLKNNPHPQAQFVYALLKDSMLYAAFHLPDIAKSTADIDWALHWGFGWELGLFEYWQANNLTATLTLFAADTKIQIAPWLHHCQQFYNDKGAYSPAEKQYLPASDLAVYRTQSRPKLLGETTDSTAITAFENQSAKCWHEDDGLLIFSIKTKLNTLNIEVIKSLQKAIILAELDFKALIIWQAQAPFCAGADLYEILAAAKVGMIEQQSLLTNIKQKAYSLLKPKLPSITHIQPIADVLELLQTTLMRLKYSPVPVVAAVKGLAIGGGCELLLHCDRCVASQESYIGLVEIGVGLLPAGGGCKEMALRASQQGGRFEILANYFKQIGLAKVSTSAQQAKTMGYLQANDVIIAQPLDLLHHAKQQAESLLRQHYRPPNPNTPIKVGGSDAKANLLAQLTNWRVGDFISDYDYFIAEKIADVLCGGDLNPATAVDSYYFLNLERKHFLTLIKESKTQERIKNMLIKHKPLSN